MLHVLRVLCVMSLVLIPTDQKENEPLLASTKTLTNQLALRSPQKHRDSIKDMFKDKVAVMTCLVYPVKTNTDTCIHAYTHMCIYTYTHVQVNELFANSHKQV